MVQANAKKKAKAARAKERTRRQPRRGPVDSKIGALIRARRVTRNISQEQLAANLGVTFQQVQKYEKGVNRVAVSTLMCVARALDCAITDLIPDEPD